MKLQYQLWLIFSVLFGIMALVIYFLIVDAYEQRVLEGQEHLSIHQGLTVTEQLRGTYPKFPERTEGHLAAYSERLDMRLLILDDEHHVQYDSFNQVTGNPVATLSIFDEPLEVPRSQFIETDLYGYVQHTLLSIHEQGANSGYLLMIGDVNLLYDDIHSFQMWVLSLMGLAVVLFFFICYGISSWFTKPIRNIIAQMKRITPEQRTFSFQYRRKDEFNELVEAIKDMVDQLNQYEQRQRQFLSASSHELKTPLATMQLISENLPAVRQEEASHQEFVQDLSLQIDKMKHMVDQLLQLNRLWDYSLKKEVLHSKEIAAHIQQQFAHMADHKQITLHFQIEDMELWVDRELFLRGVDNVLVNAIRYSPPGKEIHIQLNHQEVSAKHQSVRTTLQEGGLTDGVYMSICDQGIGIDQDELPYLMEPFYRSKEATEWNQDGTGLGLTIVKQMVDMHGGQLEIQSTVGKGTCVYFYFGNKIVTQLQSS